MVTIQTTPRKLIDAYGWRKWPGQQGLNYSSFGKGITSPTFGLIFGIAFNSAACWLNFGWGWRRMEEDQPIKIED